MGELFDHPRPERHENSVAELAELGRYAFERLRIQGALQPPVSLHEQPLGLVGAKCGCRRDSDFAFAHELALHKGAEIG